MILVLETGGVTCVAEAWSAGSDPGQRVIVRAHGGTIGLTIEMPEFIILVKGAKSAGILDLRDKCETPQETLARMSGKPATDLAP